MIRTTFDLRTPVCLNLLLAAAIVLLESCSTFEPDAPADDSVLDGPVENLTFQQSAQHLSGDKAFNDQIFSAENGLGPLFVATSCGSCHAGDGKGHPFTTLTRFGQSDNSGNQYLDRGGPQLQNRAIPGFMPEQIPPGAAFTKLTPPAVTGLGFLDRVSDADILAMSDPSDADSDGISGVPNWISIPGYVTLRSDAIGQSGKYIGRFGKKAAAYDLLQQTSGAYNQDIGIVSAYEPKDAATLQNIDPEILTSTVNDVVFYLQTLKAPQQRNPDNAAVRRGSEVFVGIGCESCHKQTLKTGFSPVEALSMKEFSAYTDLLLHDMGAGLDDGYTEGSAATSEWKTPPLWGLGLSPNSQGGQFFLLHDGRARSIEQAIQFHGGEGEPSKNRFLQLSSEDQAALIEFLKSL